MYCQKYICPLSDCPLCPAQKDFFPTRHLNAFLISLATPLANVENHSRVTSNR